MGGSQVTGNGVSCQNFLQAPQLVAKVGCLGIHPMAPKDSSSLKDRLQCHLEGEVWSL